MASNLEKEEGGKACKKIKSACAAADKTLYGQRNTEDKMLHNNSGVHTKISKNILAHKIRILNQCHCSLLEEDMADQPGSVEMLLLLDVVSITMDCFLLDFPQCKI